MKSTLIQLTEDQYIFLNEQKKKSGCSIASQIRQILCDHIRTRGIYQ